MTLGSLSVPLFAMLASFMIPNIGLVLGPLICYFISIAVVSIPLGLIFRKRTNAASPVSHLELPQFEIASPTDEEEEALEDDQLVIG